MMGGRLVLLYAAPERVTTPRFLAQLDGYLLLGHGRPGGPGTPPDPNMVVVVEAHAFGDPADYAAFRASQNDGTFI